MGHWNARVSAAALATLMAFGLAAAARAGSLVPDDPATLKQTRSLGRLIQETPDHPVHIVFVHGIRASGPGTAQTFMAGLCTHAAVRCPPKERDGTFEATERKTLSLGTMPNATVAGESIWNPASWIRSQPFVDRYVFERDGGSAPVVVDEVNWWPILVPLKCKILVEPDAYLSGVDKADLALCHRSDGAHYPWLNQAQYDKALAGPGKSGGGAWANRSIKQGIMNWGIADAVIALGPMRTYTRVALNEAFAYASEFQGLGLERQEFALVSESLGSFVVMDAAGRTAGAINVRNVVLNTADLYFFSNQLALLDLARINGVPITSDQGVDLVRIPPEPSDASAIGVLQDWAMTPPKSRMHDFDQPTGRLAIKQIIF